MIKIRRKPALAIFAIFILIAAIGYGVFAFSSFSTQALNTNLYYYTSIDGLKPGTQVDYRISYDDLFLKHYKGDALPKTVRGQIIVADDGKALLPEMRSIYDRYEIKVRNDSETTDLVITRNDKTGRFNIAGKGFEKFSDVFVEDLAGLKQAKTDWSGMFSDQLMPAPNEQGGENVRLAFRNFNIDGLENPAMIEVVIGVGGGPGPAQVNIYDPVIHDYNCDQPTAGQNGYSVFYVSTCDQARVATIVEGTGTGTITYNVVHPMMLMGEQLSAVMMQQMQILGSFFDAQEQNEAQRDVRTLVAEAQKDYYPSEQMCFFGSSLRSLSETEQTSEIAKQGLDTVFRGYMQFNEHTVTSEGYATDIRSRLEQFKTTYCDPNQSNGGLWEMCRNRNNVASPPSSGTPDQRNRFNRDVDYFRTFDRPLTLDFDLNDNIFTPEEEDVIALGRNLYWPQAPVLAEQEDYEIGFEEKYRRFLKARSITGRYNVAFNSYATIVGMKSRGQSELGATAGASYMKTMLRNFGYTDEDIEDVMGANPSYFAQMEFLTKKLYQDPNFYTQLYDKPANVERIGATLESFSLMQNRDLHESQLRQELLISLLVEQEIDKKVQDLNGRVGALSANSPPRSAN